MIIPCIDLMDGKVVQLVQGREKALEGEAPLEMLRRFEAFPEIQVIDLDAAMGNGENGAIVRAARLPRQVPSRRRHPHSGPGARATGPGRVPGDRGNRGVYSRAG